MVGSGRLERRYASPGIKTTSVNTGGLIRILFRPNDDRRHAGVIVLGGSEGGFGGPEAAMLAARGFTEFSLAYFGGKGLPATLQRIPIEYFGKAVRWMRSEPSVDPKAIALYCTSRGAGHWLPLAYEPVAGSRQNRNLPKFLIGVTPEGTVKAEPTLCQELSDSYPSFVSEGPTLSRQ